MKPVFNFPLNLFHKGHQYFKTFIVELDISQLLVISKYYVRDV